MVKRLGRHLRWLLLLVAPAALAQVQVGETHMNAGGLFTFGYSGDYGNQIPSDHGLDFGASGTLNGYYYNPNFLNFSITPYYNRSKADSDYQSLTNASGVAGTANFFTGSHFPGSVSYHYDYNSTGTLGLQGVPNFTTQGNGQGFGINWSALFPGWPTLSAGYQEGSGSGTLYGTDQESTSSLHIFNLRSTYQWDGFNLNAYYDHTTNHALYPEFLVGETGDDVQNSSGHDIGVGASRSIPLWDGSFFSSYTHSVYSGIFTFSGEPGTNSGYSDNIETVGANFKPNDRLSLNFSQSYISDLSAYLVEGQSNNGNLVPPVSNLGSNSYSNVLTGGATYRFTNYLFGVAQASHFNQYYFGQNFGGTYIIGNLEYQKRLLDMFTFSAGVIENNNAVGTNSLGFTGTVNYYRRFGSWITTGNFTYAQNVQSVLVTNSQSFYNYAGSIHKRWSPRVQWSASFGGSHSGLNTYANTTSNSESFSTSLSLRQLTMQANYVTATGLSVLTAAGLVPLPPIPGELNPNLTLYNADSYGGGLSWTPVRRLVLTGSYSRAFSHTLTDTLYSRNETDVWYGQLQYRLRRISLLAGVTNYKQGISAIETQPSNITSYFVGIQRWFNFF